MQVFRPGPHDREIVRLAVPALGALAAEPLYLLADTAIVGHLGTNPLAGLAVAGSVLTAAFGVFNFLAYSTTASVARQVGAGNRRAAAEFGIDGCWLAVGLGLLLTVIGVAFAPLIVDVMGASHVVHPFAVTYLRISILGAPALLLTLAGAGYLRGMQDTRTTLVIAVAANTVNLLLELALVYTLDLGIAGSAWGTVVAQYGAAAAFLVVVGRGARRSGGSLRPRPTGIRANAAVGSRLVVRTGALLVTLLTATAIAARFGDDDVAAHQVAMQVLLFLALSLDALAIAAQAMVGRYLGADAVHDARASARRLLEWGVVAGVVLAVVVAVSRPWLAALFSNDDDVRDARGATALVRRRVAAGRGGGLRARRRAHRCRRRGLPRRSRCSSRRSRCTSPPRCSWSRSTRVCSGSGRRSRCGWSRASSPWWRATAPTAGKSPVPSAPDELQKVAKWNAGATNRYQISAHAASYVSSRTCARSRLCGVASLRT